jgi:hypothetical protein
VHSQRRWAELVCGLCWVKLTLPPLVCLGGSTDQYVFQVVAGVIIVVITLKVWSRMLCHRTRTSRYVKHLAVYWVNTDHLLHYQC